jgi:hypothetical protein
MTATEFTQLKRIFMECVNEVRNDQELGGSLVAIGVNLASEEED